MRFANNPLRRSWIDVPHQSDFPIQNLPFGVFLPEDDVVTIGTRIGDTAIDLSALHQLGYFEGLEVPEDVFFQDNLNDFISLGKAKWRAVRDRLAWIFDLENPELRQNPDHVEKILYSIENVQMLMPVFIQDYTDFYSSREHATNVGIMFRGPENALMPNWLHLPVGYHGRSSSIVVSGIDIHRPMGQSLPNNVEFPVFGPSQQMDFELEMAFITTEGKPLGQSIGVNEAEDFIFGMVIFNDWSARDLQKWEYVPLGPFLGKNFGSSISPWIVTLDALEPTRIPGPEQQPKPLAYLQQDGNRNFNIDLEVWLETEDGVQTKISHSNTKYLYWSIAQQLAHHTVNGCNINCGDLMASGTISGPEASSYGSMLELAWKGTKPLTLNNGETRSFLANGDAIVMKAYANFGSLRIGFGEVRSRILPPFQNQQ